MKSVSPPIIHPTGKTFQVFFTLRLKALTGIPPHLTGVPPHLTDVPPHLTGVPPRLTGVSLRLFHVPRVQFVFPRDDDLPEARRAAAGRLLMRLSWFRRNAPRCLRLNGRSFADSMPETCAAGCAVKIEASCGKAFKHTLAGSKSLIGSLSGF